MNDVSLYLPCHLQNLSTILDSHSSPKNARPLSCTSTWVEGGMERTIPWNHQHQYHLHIEPASPGPEPEAIVPRVSAALAQVPGLQLALLHSLLGPLLASCADTGNSSDRYISPATSWSRQPHPAHLYVGQSAGLAHHTQEPPHSAGDIMDNLETHDT